MRDLVLAHGLQVLCQKCMHSVHCPLQVFPSHTRLVYQPTGYRMIYTAMTPLNMLKSTSAHSPILAQIIMVVRAQLKQFNFPRNYNNYCWANSMHSLSQQSCNSTAQPMAIRAMNYRGRLSKDYHATNGLVYLELTKLCDIETGANSL